MISQRNIPRMNNSPTNESSNLTLPFFLSVSNKHTQKHSHFHHPSTLTAASPSPNAATSTAHSSPSSSSTSHNRTPPPCTSLPSPSSTLHAPPLPYAQRRLLQIPLPTRPIEHPAAVLQLPRRHVLDVVVLLHREHEERDVHRHSAERFAREQLALDPRESLRNVHHFRRSVIRLINRERRQRVPQPVQNRGFQLLLEPVLVRHAAPRGTQPKFSARLQRTKNRGTLRLHHLRLNRGTRSRARRRGNVETGARLGGERGSAGIRVVLGGSGDR